MGNCLAKAWGEPWIRIPDWKYSLGVECGVPVMTAAPANPLVPVQSFVPSFSSNSTQLIFYFAWRVVSTSEHAVSSTPVAQNAALKCASALLASKYVIIAVNR